MPFDIRARNGGKLVLIRHSGNVDCREITDAIGAIERLQVLAEPLRLLVDVRGATSFPRYQELFVWLCQNTSYSPEISRLALVTTAAHSETIKAIAEGHQTRGIPARVFDDELEALTWVIQSRQVSQRGLNRNAAFDNLAAVTIYVSDLDVARKFYADILGLALFEHAGQEHELLFKLNNSSVVVSAAKGSAGSNGDLTGRATGIRFRVQDIDGTFVRLSSLGVRFSGEPRALENGERMLDFYDPDDNVLTLVS